MDVVSFILLFARASKSDYFSQAQQQLLEFMKNFYEVFPEYRVMDVRVFLLVVCFSVKYINTLFKDLPRRGKFCRPMDTLLWSVLFLLVAHR